MEQEKVKNNIPQENNENHTSDVKPSIKKEPTDQSGPLKDLDQNAAAALSYMVPPFTGIFIFVMEKQNKFVRFHAFQSLLFGFLSWGAISIAESLKGIVIGFVLSPIVSVAVVALWLVLLWKSYNNESFEIPYLGKIAKEQAEKTN